MTPDLSIGSDDFRLQLSSSSLARILKIDGIPEKP
jgi:hypothetical protein